MDLHWFCQQTVSGFELNRKGRRSAFPFSGSILLITLPEHLQSLLHPGFQLLALWPVAGPGNMKKRQRITFLQLTAALFTLFYFYHRAFKFQPYVIVIKHAFNGAHRRTEAVKTITGFHRVTKGHRQDPIFAHMKGGFNFSAGLREVR